MSIINPVFQVLVSKGNTAVLAANQKIEALAPGQIGVFNQHTNLSIDGTVLQDARDFYIAVGVGTNGQPIDDIRTSAGRYMQRMNFHSYNFKRAAAPLPEIVDITKFKAKCDTEYSIRVEARNQENYSVNGYNQAAKTFSYTTGNCPYNDCPTCVDNSANDLARGMVREINKGGEGVIKAEMIDYVTTPDTPQVVTEDGYDTWVSQNTDPDNNIYRNLGIRITSIPSARTPFNGGINIKYFSSRDTHILVSKGEGFEGNGVVTVFQKLRYQQGLGYDIAQLEYEAGGWNGEPGPYRLSTLAEMPLASFRSFVDVSASYSQFVFEYDLSSVSGFLDYLNGLRTIVAIPVADTTTMNSFATVMDAILVGVNGFGPLADDVSYLNSNSTKDVSQINNTNLDGIG